MDLPLSFDSPQDDRPPRRLILGRTDPLHKVRSATSLKRCDGDARHERRQPEESADPIRGSGEFPVADRWFLPLGELECGILCGKSTSQGKLVVPAREGRTTVTCQGENVPNGVRHPKLQTAAAETVIFSSGVNPLPFEVWSA